MADELKLETLLDGLDRLQSTFAIYDANDQLVFANQSAVAAWPKLYQGLKDGLSRYEATRNEIESQFPGISAEKLERYTQYAMNTVTTSEPHEVTAQGGKVFQTFHEPLGTDGKVGIGIDLTELKQQQHALKQLAEENYQLANKDPLTGLSNRRHFIQQIDQMIEVRAASKTPFVMALLDLDGFKLVNDVYGHPVGDDLLKQAAKRLQDVLGHDILLARLGGDEFGFVCETRVSRDAIEALGNQLCKALASPFHLGSEFAKIATSIGFALFPDTGTERSVLFKRADYALYHAKETGKGRAIRFCAEHELRIRRQSNLELRIRDANMDEQFHVEFQPICDANTFEVVGFEALARWDDPFFASVSPSEFIPIAEQTGQMQRLTTALLRKSLALASDWPSDAYLSFNLSTLDVTSPEYAQQLIEIAKRADFAGRRVVLEITENAMIRDPASLLDVLNLLREAGFAIALDDFGTGFSSLKHVATMPLDFLKIDSSLFDGDCVNDVSAKAVLETIFKLSDSLDITSIVEGVETQEHLDMVQSANAKCVQGFLMSRPLTQTQLLGFLKSERPHQRISRLQELKKAKRPSRLSSTSAAD